MNSSIRHVLLATVACGAITFAHAQGAVLQNTNIAAEVSAGSLTLPSGVGGAAVFAPCAECPPKSFPATAATRYLLGRKEVTLQELKAAIIGKPSLIVTVKYSASTGELVSITADLPASTAAGSPN
ncbi:MAG: hypothetical protein IRZ28_09680 [Steroidobacteraceae bacterium]|nr:hypothetical protein [Steroidobacteraceae bacterium]